MLFSLTNPEVATLMMGVFLFAVLNASVDFSMVIILTL